MGIRTATEVEEKMSLERERKAYQITIKILVYAPYHYVYSLMGRLVRIIRGTIAQKRLVDITYSFKEVGRR